MTDQNNQSNDQKDWNFTAIEAIMLSFIVICLCAAAVATALARAGWL